MKQESLDKPEHFPISCLEQQKDYKLILYLFV